MNCCIPSEGVSVMGQRQPIQASTIAPKPLHPSDDANPQLSLPCFGLCFTLTASKQHNLKVAGGGEREEIASHQKLNSGFPDLLRSKDDKGQNAED